MYESPSYSAEQSSFLEMTHAQNTVKVYFPALAHRSLLFDAHMPSVPVGQHTAFPWGPPGVQIKESGDANENYSEHWCHSKLNFIFK